jgi:pyruvate dehydrogenase E2 component (dihydrolipoamide acetyltransferase)
MLEPGAPTDRELPDARRVEAGAGGKGQAAIHEPSASERAVARRTAEARATVPDLELGLEVAMDAAAERCQREDCSLDGLLVSACAAALRAVPRANGAYRDGRFEFYSRVNVGFVVAHEDTYVIPTVFDADRKSPAELSAEIARLVADAAARILPPPAFSGATFTIWNAGALGLTRAGAIINPPQAGALAAGALREVPVVQDGRVRAGQLISLTLACDHRILYGAHAAALLTTVKQVLET